MAGSYQKSKFSIDSKGDRQNGEILGGIGEKLKSAIFRAAEA